MAYKTVQTACGDTRATIEISTEKDLRHLFEGILSIVDCWEYSLVNGLESFDTWYGLILKSINRNGSVNVEVTKHVYDSDAPRYSVRF